MVVSCNDSKKVHDDSDSLFTSVTFNTIADDGEEASCEDVGSTGCLRTNNRYQFERPKFGSRCGLVRNRTGGGAIIYACGNPCMLSECACWLMVNVFTLDEISY